MKVTKALLLVLATGFCLVYADDNVAMESEANLRKVKPYRQRPESEDEHYQRPRHGSGPRVHHQKRDSYAHREREARREENSWSPLLEEDKPVFEQQHLEEFQHYNNPEHGSLNYVPVEETGKQRYVIYQGQPERAEKGEEKIKASTAQSSGHTTGSYLSLIKQNMDNGKLLGYSSFVEHFSENDDAEELKTAMREGSMDDIKRLVPKSQVSFQMYHGEGDEKPVKTIPVQTHHKAEMSWNQLNKWHNASPAPFAPHEEETSYHVVPFTQKTSEKKNRSKNHYRSEHRPRNQYQVEEPKRLPHITPVNPTEFNNQKVISNEIQQTEENYYPHIVQSISYQLPSETIVLGKEYEAADAYNSEPQQALVDYSSGGLWNHEKEKTQYEVELAPSESLNHVSTPKPPETSKLYYEYSKTLKPEKSTPAPASHRPSYKLVTETTTKYPKIGRIVVGPQRFDEPTTTTDTATYQVVKKQNSQHYLVQGPKRPEEVYPPFVATTMVPLRHSVSTTPKKYRSVTHNWSTPDVSGDNDSKYGKPTMSTRLEAPKRPRTQISKLEKILNRQAQDIGRGKRNNNNNVFLTQQFPKDVNQNFYSSKSEWVPKVRYDYHGLESQPAIVYATPSPARMYTEIEELQPEEQRQPEQLNYNHANNNSTEEVFLLTPESRSGQTKFSISAPYHINKNRRKESQINITLR